MSENLAPCVAVVGPPNSGKTTLLHLLDDALQRHPSGRQVYVVKGNPDGTGRYLFHAPALREALKERVKGAWCETTVAVVCEWIEECRRHLDLVLVDLGGRHAPGNRLILARCTHVVVVARVFGDPTREREEGMASWVRACRDSGLEVVARLRSVVEEGRPRMRLTGDALSGVFRGDAAAPGDLTNWPVVDRLVEALLALAAGRSTPSYLDLRLRRDWAAGDLATVGGRRPEIESTVATGRRLVLGGRAPLWAYAAGLHAALDVDPDAAVAVFDPKVPAGLVPIPRRQGREVAELWTHRLEVAWHSGLAEGGCLLDLRITTADRFLPLPRPEELAALPVPAGTAPAELVVASGAAPTWLHLAYSRWLRALPGVRTVAIADARTGSAFLLSGRGAPAAAPWPAAGARP